MTSLSADTAELPRVRRSAGPVAVAGPPAAGAPAPTPVAVPAAVAPPAPGTVRARGDRPGWVHAPFQPAVVDAGPGRAERRRQRLQARRLRRRYAALGVVVLGGMLAATVIVLNVIH